MSVLAHRFLILLGLLTMATPCVAQTSRPAETPAAATFEKLQEVARPGTRVVVKDLKGRSVEGALQSVTADGLRLNVYGSTREVKRDDIQMVRSKPDSSANGAVIGTLAGAACALGVVFLSGDDLTADQIAGALAIIPAGGVAGFFLDRALSDRRLLYEKSSVSKVSFEHALGGNLGVRADVGVVTPQGHRPAPRVAGNVVISLGSHKKAH